MVFPDLNYYFNFKLYGITVTAALYGISRLTGRARYASTSQICSSSSRASWTSPSDGYDHERSRPLSLTSPRKNGIIRNHAQVRWPPDRLLHWPMDEQTRTNIHIQVSFSISHTRKQFQEIILLAWRRAHGIPDAITTHTACAAACATTTARTRAFVADHIRVCLHKV